MRTSIHHLYLFIICLAACTGTEKKAVPEYEGVRLPPDSISIQAMDSSQNISVIPLQDPEGFLWGLKDTASGQLVMPYKYHFISDFAEDRAVLLMNDKYGYIDRQGKEIVPPVYDVAWNYQDGYARVGGNFERVSYIDKQGKELFPLIYYDANSVLLEKQRVIVQDGSNYGMMDFKGKFIVPLQYEFMRLMPPAYCVFSKNHLQGLMDLDGKEILPPVYDDIQDFHDGRARLRKNGRYGFMDSSAKELFFTDYGRVWDYSEGYALVVKDQKAGYIDKNGKLMIPLLYDANEAGFSEGFVPVSIMGKYGFINTKCALVVPLKYDGADHYLNGTAKVRLGKYSTYLDSKGREVLPMIYEGVRRSGGHFIIARKDKNWFVYDMKTKTWLPDSFENIHGTFDHGNIYFVQQHKKMGALDSAFRPLIAPQYEQLDFAGPGVISAIKNGKFGYLDMKGKPLTPFVYEEHGGYINGIYKVMRNKKYGLMNLSCKLVTRIVYDEIGEFKEGMAIVRKKSKYGFINYEGKEMIPVMYDEVKPFDYEMAEVRKGKETFRIDKKGRRLEEEEEY